MLKLQFKTLSDLITECFKLWGAANSHHQAKVEHSLCIWEVCTLWDPKDCSQQPSSGQTRALSWYMGCVHSMGSNRLQPTTSSGQIRAQSGYMGSVHSMGSYTVQPTAINRPKESTVWLYGNCALYGIQ